MIKETIRAKVGDITISDIDVQNFINLLPIEQQGQLNNEEGFKKITEELINQELLFLDALDNKYDEDEKYLEEVDRLKKNVLKQFALAKIFSSVKLDDKDLMEYYDSHIEHFDTPMAINASHILVDSEEKALEIKEQIEKGEDFAKLAKELSTCPSSSVGGDLGTFSPGQMVPEFDEVAQKIEIGKISDPVKTKFGYHLILVSDRKEPSRLSFEECKDELSRQFLALKQQEAYINKTVDLRKKYNVEKF